MFVIDHDILWYSLNQNWGTRKLYVASSLDKDIKSFISLSCLNHKNTQL